MQVLTRFCGLRYAFPGPRGEWRAGHERFWHGLDYRASVGDPSFTVDGDTLAVLVRFRVVPA